MCVDKIHGSMTCIFVIFTELSIIYLQIDSSKRTTEDCLKPPVKVLRLQKLLWGSLAGILVILGPSLLCENITDHFVSSYLIL